MTRHMFAGGSTPMGFVNFFDQIMPLNTAKTRYFLKGSSGSGKSTFMKKIAAGFEKAGFDTDIYHCANDADSLDGVSVKGKGICVIDATAPHVSDPEVPAAIDKIIDFAKFIDESRVYPHIDEIRSLLRVKKLLNEKARGYFAAAGNVYTAERTACETALNQSLFQAYTREWLGIFEGVGAPDNLGADRKMFLRAVTPDGVISFAGTVFAGCRVYGLRSNAGAGTDVFLAKLRDAAHMHGLNTESFYCPFEPGKLEYLVLPEMKKAFAVMGGPYGYPGNVDELIDFSRCFDSEILNGAKIGFEHNAVLFERLLEASVELMKESRALHAGIEKIYINAMNFDKINDMTERILRKLLL